VDALGEDVADVSVGDRVAALSYHGFAEYDVAAQTEVVRLPAVLEREPVPGEPLACAVNAFRRSGIERGDTVAVVGIGFLGAVLTALAVRAGARVLAISRRAFSLELARGLGAQETIVLDDPDVTVARVSEATNGDLCDVAIEATGQQLPLDVAAAVTRVRGRLVIAGFHQDGRRSVDLTLWNWRGLDVVNTHERDPAVYVDGMRAALAEIAGAQLDPSRLYTHTFPLSRLGEAFATACARPDGFVKAIVRP
jgi:threonine dehydrogenase-like Zn-dependent dehydrogenase